MASITVAGLAKYFGAVRAVGPVDLKVCSGEFVSLLGPSGCGKTTTLRMIAGFEQPSAGSIEIGGRDVADVPVERRGIGMVFQSYALFPHLSVFENVAFGLRLRSRDRDSIGRTVGEALDMVGLASYAHRMPRELSGGQQQRVALARALAVRPAVLLLDEPLSNLDLKLREQMRDEIRRLQRQIGITALYVTHDQGEAMSMSDRVAVMNGGLVEQIGAPREVYEHPASMFVARFIGQCTVLPGELTRLDDTAARFTTLAGAEFVLRLHEGEVRTGKRLGLVIRPEFVRVGTGAAAPEPAETNAFSATVADVVYVGERVNVTARLANGDVIAVGHPVTPGRPLPQPGEELRLAIAPHELAVVALDTPLPT